MKKKTKILIIVLSCVLGSAAIFGGSLAINNAVNQIKGTEAAKILLARDRMDASDTEFKWTDIVASVATSSDNTVVSENDEITHGATYKMKFKVETLDGVVDAYVYCTVPTSV